MRMRRNCPKITELHDEPRYMYGEEGSRRPGLPASTVLVLMGDGLGSMIARNWLATAVMETPTSHKGERRPKTMMAKPGVEAARLRYRIAVMTTMLMMLKANNQTLIGKPLRRS